MQDKQLLLYEFSYLKATTMLKSKVIGTTCTLALFTHLQFLPGWAKEPPRLWDQNMAENMVKEVLQQEETNTFAWDKIAWLEDPELATRQATGKQKPILVYFFLRGKVGPAAAPC